MDTMSAFARGEASRGREEMVFDWDRAAQRIRESGATSASAGLGEDWEWTGGTIFAAGQPVTTSYTYLASTWATPELHLELPDGGYLVEDCYRMANDAPGWDEETKWPESARALLAVAS
jgi:hypothetical protein